jgi:YD repeat-containing protein
MKRLGLVIATTATLCMFNAYAATTYTYDPLGRVTKVTFDNGNKIVYCYDQAGNRSTVTVSTAGTACQPPSAQAAREFTVGNRTALPSDHTGSASQP